MRGPARSRSGRGRAMRALASLGADLRQPATGASIRGCLLSAISQWRCQRARRASWTRRSQALGDVRPDRRGSRGARPSLTQSCSTCPRAPRLPWPMRVRSPEYPAAARWTPTLWGVLAAPLRRRGPARARDSLRERLDPPPTSLSRRLLSSGGRGPLDSRTSAGIYQFQRGLDHHSLLARGTTRRVCYSGAATSIATGSATLG